MTDASVPPLDGFSRLLGHEIAWHVDRQEFVYTDDLSPAGGPGEAPPRPCVLCLHPPAWCEPCGNWHDPCVGHIPGVVSACCGHGFPDDQTLLTATVAALTAPSPPESQP